jgi:cellulose synthase (UDP-forming)
VPVLVSQGKSPDDLKSFIGQQYRWAEGSLSLAADHGFHTEATMTLAQRLSFWSGFLYYVTTALNAIFAPLAVLTMLWAFPGRVESSNVLPLTGAIALWLLVLPLVSVGRWRVEVLRVQAIYGFAHLFCIVDLLRGKPSAWVATNAGGRTPLAARVSATMATYITITQAAIVAGVARGLYDYGIGRYWANIALVLLGAYVYLPVAWISITSLRTARRAARTATPRVRVDAALDGVGLVKADA